MERIDNWILRSINDGRRIVFVVPLSSADEIPALPGPNDVTLSPNEILEIASAAIRAAT